ncbi:high mobility group protein DSP1-like isoform X2 [Paramacrobiotus metropolitanus]|nr:high mobility group protein DSP1-like isoform X2 [Paramacrobiotus metropolitanus]
MAPREYRQLAIKAVCRPVRYHNPQPGPRENTPSPIENHPSTSSGLRRTTADPTYAASAFSLFCVAERPGVIVNNPAMDSEQIDEELARLWREANPSVKARFVQMAARNHRRQKRNRTVDRERRIRKPRKRPQ